MGCTAGGQQADVSLTCCLLLILWAHSHHYCKSYTNIIIWQRWGKDSKTDTCLHLGAKPEVTDVATVSKSRCFLLERQLSKTKKWIETEYYLVNISVTFSRWTSSLLLGENLSIVLMLGFINICLNPVQTFLKQQLNTDRSSLCGSYTEHHRALNKIYNMSSERPPIIIATIALSLEHKHVVTEHSLTGLTVICCNYGL